MNVWVDCTAAAHPLVLRPIIERLEGGGHRVRVTAREYGQTLGVLERLGIPYERIGVHAGASLARKASAVASRSLALVRWARPQRFDLALGHGSVDLAVVSAALRIPSVQMQDYEHAGLQRQLAFRVARRVLVPDAIPIDAMRRAGASERKLFRYPGLKEDYYLADFQPDPAVLEELGIDAAAVLVVVRPPPETSAYHADNPVEERLLDRLSAADGVVAVVIPRTPAQAERIRSRRAPTLVVPDRAVDAQSLIAFADLVVSAGGTMNREAVALGTPAYTIFSGRMGAVDERLIADGRLIVLRDPDDLRLSKRETKPGAREPRDPQLLVDAILDAASGDPRRAPPAPAKGSARRMI
jgi:predicted glycosyltransferase